MYRADRLAVDLLGCNTKQQVTRALTLLLHTPLSSQPPVVGAYDALLAMRQVQRLKREPHLQSCIWQLRAVEWRSCQSP